MNPNQRALAGLVGLLLAVGAAMQWWQGRQQGSVASQLVAHARPGDLRMLSSNTCVYCTAARQWLQRNQVAHSECFIETDADCAALYRATGARGTPTVLVRGQAQLGFSPERVVQALKAPAI